MVAWSQDKGQILWEGVGCWRESALALETAAGGGPAAGLGSGDKDTLSYLLVCFPVLLEKPQRFWPPCESWDLSHLGAEPSASP